MLSDIFAGKQMPSCVFAYDKINAETAYQKFCIFKTGDSCINQREEVCQKRDTPLQ